MKEKDDLKLVEKLAKGKKSILDQLNKVMKDAEHNHPPPLYQGKRLKLFYITQTAVRPPTFVIFVNKADGDLKKAAMRSAADYKSALLLMRPKVPCWTASVVLVSALKGQGLEEVWQKIQAFEFATKDSGELDQLRSEQAKAWMWSEINDQLVDAFQANYPQKIEQVEQAVSEGKTPATAAAQKLLRDFLK